MSWKRLILRASIGLLVLLVSTPPVSYSQTSKAASPFTKAQLDQMVAPIALYPDSLLAQILMASTYPLEVVQADRWEKKYGKLKGDARKAELAKVDWDASVKGLIPFPEVLSMMKRTARLDPKVGRRLPGAEGRRDGLGPGTARQGVLTERPQEHQGTKGGR